jgi:hypothetical protein
LGYVIIIGNPTRGLNNPGHAARIFVDTGANVNTISRNFHQQLVDSRLNQKFTPGPDGGLSVTLAGDNRMTVSGDKTTLMVEVKTNFGTEVGEQEF